MEKYYALYDVRLGGFKAEHAGTAYKEVLESGAKRACELSQYDKEPCPNNLTDEEILEMYGYEVREITKEQYNVIKDSNEVGWLTTVKMN